MDISNYWDTYLEMEAQMEDIIKGNIIIAKYMNSNVEDFHKDWNHLMLVIKTISQIDDIYESGVYVLTSVGIIGEPTQTIFVLDNNNKI